MATPEQVYSEWRASLKTPDDSLFYYHPDLERILLGMAIYAISSPPLIRKIGKAESVSVINRYITDLITAWIDGDDDTFEQMFHLTITVAEAYMLCLVALAQRHPNQKNNIRKLNNFFSYAAAAGGDMNQALADKLLDDLTTDGKTLESPMIKEFGSSLLRLMGRHDLEIPASEMNRLNGW